MVTQKKEGAPLYRTLCALSRRDALRLHMPGHKGTAPSPLFSVAAIDYTELSETGNLYTGEGVIAEAEALAAQAWGAPRGFFLTGGSTQGILAGLSLCAAPGDTILLDRNAHRAFFHAMALIDLDYIPCDARKPGEIEAQLVRNPQVKAVCITSPTYYGVIAPVKEIAGVCRRRKVRLFVDEAHGAHLPFVGRGPCAVGRGAGVCVCSAHKTLPALGGAALLFTDASFDAETVRESTALFGSSSPSYAIMASIDYARCDLLEGGGGARYMRCARFVAELRDAVNRRGVFHALCEEDALTLDPGRFTLHTACAGMSGYRVGAVLEEKYHIYPEMSDRENVVFIFTCNDSAESAERLNRALCEIEKEGGAPLERYKLPPPGRRVMRVREAVFAPRESVTAHSSAGRIAAQSVAPYPPGVPVIAPGERIGEETIAYLEAMECCPDTIRCVTEETGGQGT